MTLEDFLLEVEFAPEFVKEHIRKWILPTIGGLGEHCPISAIASWRGNYADCGDAWSSGRTHLNMNMSDIELIINAADCSHIWLKHKRECSYSDFLTKLYKAVGIDYEKYYYPTNC